MKLEILASIMLAEGACREKGEIGCGWLWGSFELFVRCVLSPFDVSLFGCDFPPFSPISRRGVMGIVQFLVEKKGDVTAKNAAGMTPLHTACNNGHVSSFVTLAEG